MDATINVTKRPSELACGLTVPLGPNTCYTVGDRYSYARRDPTSSPPTHPPQTVEDYAESTIREIFSRSSSPQLTPRWSADTSAALQRNHQAERSGASSPSQCTIAADLTRMAEELRQQLHER